MVNGKAQFELSSLIQQFIDTGPFVTEALVFHRLRGWLDGLAMTVKLDKHLGPRHRSANRPGAAVLGFHKLSRTPNSATKSRRLYVASESGVKGRKEGRVWVTDGSEMRHYLRRWSPVEWGPIACRCSGGSMWACGRFSCRSCGRARRVADQSSPPPTPSLQSPVHARFSPWTRTWHRHITGLCDLETVREHVAAVGYLCQPELHA